MKLKTINDYLDDIDSIFYYAVISGEGKNKKQQVRKVLEELVDSIPNTRRHQIKKGYVEYIEILENKEWQKKMKE